ncbi:MAG: hypothetical protein ACRD8O_21125 [Bryobacteraceae bacterium]
MNSAVVKRGCTVSHPIISSMAIVRPIGCWLSSNAKRERQQGDGGETGLLRKLRSA